MMEDFNRHQFGTVDEAVTSLLSRENDIAGVNKLRYKEVAMDVYRDMNLSAIKHVKRALFTIDKRLNGIVLPEAFYKFSTISVITKDHQILPLVYNTNITDDIVDLGLDANCECQCTDSICNYKRNYETITEEVMAIMPDETEQKFIKTIRKFIQSDGSAYVEVNEPTAIFVDGIHTATELKRTAKLLCKLDIKPCGCIINNDHNRKMWTSHGSSLAPDSGVSLLCEWGVPSPEYYPRSATYNFSDDGKRIIFPTNFAYDKILLRWYEGQSTKDILIPHIAKEAFLAGIKYFISDYDKKESIGKGRLFATKYVNLLSVLRSKTSTMMLNEFYEYCVGRNAAKGVYFDHNFKRSDYYL